MTTALRPTAKQIPAGAEGHPFELDAAALAHEYEVSHGTISDVVRRRTWKHVSEAAA